MEHQERRISTSIGNVAVVDFGGSGPDVLLIHSIGQSAVLWNEFAATLTDAAHVVALDLPGHGRSDAELTEVADTTGLLIEVIENLGLVSPVLVGYDVGACFAAGVAAVRRDLAGAVVGIDSPLVVDQQTVTEIVDAVGSPEILNDLVRRFDLGRTGPDEASRRAFIDEITARMMRDWLNSAPDAERSRRFVERGTVSAADGSWISRPTLETLQTYTHDPFGSEFRPGREMLAEFDAPVLLVTLTEGHNGDGGAAMAALAEARPNLRLVTVEGDFRVVQRRPDGLRKALDSILPRALLAQ